MFSQITPDDLPSPDMASAEYGAAFVKMFITLIALSLLLWGTVWLLRRIIQKKLQKGSGERAIEILEKKMLSPKTMLYWVEVEGQKVLIAESHLEVRGLHTSILPRKEPGESL